MTITTNLKAKLIRRLLEKDENSQSGFTLVELIVVVVIIGILSSIAIPSFQNASDKAKQKEASTIVASWVKAAQAYYTEVSDYPKNTKDLGGYITVTGCSTNRPQTCKTATMVDYSNNASRSWIYTPSGNFQVYMQRRHPRIHIIGRPTGTYASSGMGVTGCYNYVTGSTKVVDQTNKGAGVPTTNC